jgi:hypothetical protein
MTISVFGRPKILRGRLLWQTPLADFEQSGNNAPSRYAGGSFQGVRIGRESMALAESSPMNCSRTGSHFSLRPTLIAMLAKWQTVETRWPISTGK